MKADTPASAENLMVRILTGKRLKYTIRIMLKLPGPDGARELEVQSANPPELDWNTDARQVMLCARLPGEDKTYGPKYPICEWENVYAVTVELNDGA